MQESTQKTINVDLFENKVNKVLKIFGYKTEKVFPTNPADAFFFDKIFSCIEEHILNNNVDTSNGDVISVIRNIDNNCISKYFDNFPINPIYNISYNADALGQVDVQHCKNYMIAVSEMILKEIEID